MNDTDRMVAALRLATSDAQAAFELLKQVVAGARARGDTAAVSAGLRALVFAATLAGDHDAKLRFEAEWREATPGQHGGSLAEPDQAAEKRARTEHALMSEVVMVAPSIPRETVQGLERLRQKALGAGWSNVSRRCLETLIVAATRMGQFDRAVRLSFSLRTEVPSPYADYFLGRSLAFTGAVDASRETLKVALEGALANHDEHLCGLIAAVPESVASWATDWAVSDAAERQNDDDA